MDKVLTVCSVPDHRPQLAQSLNMDRLRLPFVPRPSRCPHWGYDGEACPATAGGDRVTELRLDRAFRQPLRAPVGEEPNGHSSDAMAPTGKTSASGASDTVADVARGDRKLGNEPAMSGATGAAAADGAAAPQADAAKQLQTRSAGASMQDVSSMTALAGLAAAACDHPDASGDGVPAAVSGRRLQKRDPPSAEKHQPAAKKQRTAPGTAARPVHPPKRAARVKLESRPRPSSPPPPPPQEVYVPTCICSPSFEVFKTCIPHATSHVDDELSIGLDCLDCQRVWCAQQGCQTVIVFMCHGLHFALIEATPRSGSEQVFNGAEQLMTSAGCGYQ